MGRGKKTNRNYITRNEWINDFQGKSDSVDTRGVRGIPFHYCHLTLRPFNTPVCTKGSRSYIFDMEPLVDYITDYGVHPVTGEPLKTKDLTRLHIQKNEDGKYYCPIMNKVFNDHSHIVAVGNTGNVYSWEAVDELNIKRKFWKDLLTDEPFKRKDLIILQDPSKPPTLKWTDYYHVKKTKEEQEEQTNKDKEPVNSKETTKASNEYDGGFTCAGFTAAPKKELTEAEKPGIVVKEKGYVQLVTNIGQVNIELYCHLVPKTCENFIGLCKKGYYDNVIFHRNIPGFMIQGGDPTGTGRGGTSIWNEKFYDEFKQQITHNKRGILSMANSGPKTNGSQFFILYKQQPHLNNKHTVFGCVVGGMETLDKMENTPTGEEDKPLSEIKIISTNVFKDPFADKIEQEANEPELQKQKEEDSKVGQWFSNPQGEKLESFKNGVGKYIKPVSNTTKRSRETLNFGELKNDQPRKKPKTTQFSW